MSTEWKLLLEVQSSSEVNTNSMAAALVTDCEIDYHENSFSILIREKKAKDLRAMWNTRVRGLIAVDSLVTMIDEMDVTVN